MSNEEKIKQSLNELYPGLKTCSKCLLPETQETITYDENGVCSVCRQSMFKKEQVDWKKKEEDLRTLIEEHKGKADYDCIIPFSGGKDSTFTAYKLVKDYKLNPLIVSFDHCFYRPKTLANVERTLKELGVDFISFRPKWNVVQRLMLEGLIRKGDFQWYEHAGIFSFPMHAAIKFKVPLIFWGEQSNEYTSYYGVDETEEVDEVRFNRFVNLGITAQDMVGMIQDIKGGVTLKEMWPYTYPPLKDLKAIKYRSVCLGSYIPWDPKQNSEIIKRELGWQGDLVEGIPPEYYYEKIEYRLQGVRDYIKFIKRDFGRTAHLMSLELRKDRITKEEAIELIKKYDGKRPASLDYFLKIMDMTEEQFMEIVLKHVIAPYKFDPKNIRGRGEKLPDQDLWDDS